MKQIILTFLFIQIWTSCLAQASLIDSLYPKAMQLYNAKNYKQSAILFDNIFFIQKISDPVILYNASCVFSLNGEVDKSLNVLLELAEKYYYSSYKHLTTDTDLDNLHNSPKWITLVEKVSQNKSTLPQRKRTKIRNELLKAKKLLEADNGKLWGVSLWNDRFLVLDNDNTVYTLNNLLPNSNNDSLLYYKPIKEQTLQQTNTNQTFEGEKWATVQDSYVTAKDSSQTIIHELFHLHHLGQMSLSGNIVEYLDDYKARIFLRSEFEALRNCLKSIQINKESNAKQFLNDAIYFRTEREKMFKKYNKNALELETLEGLATYTGYKLSAFTNLYPIAIKELNGREQTYGLNRSFAYATGLAYGIIFDYFKIQWRTDLKHIYSFTGIYNNQIKTIHFKKKEIKDIKTRNQFYQINQEELNRKNTTDSIHSFYQNIFKKQPVLIINMDTSNKTPLTMSYDMNSTFTFGKDGIIYSSISGTSPNASLFGSFKTTGETTIGKSGILISSKFDKLTFTKPLKVEGNTIFGDYYTIELNKGWKVIQIDKKGNMEIVKE